MTASECVLEIEAASFAYPGGGTVLRGVSLRADSGRCLGLIGPNGAGKSTLLRLAASLLRPASGAVRIEGRPLESLPALDVARRVGWVPQEIETAFPFTVAQVVLMGRYPRLGPFGFESPRDREAAERCLADLGLERLADRPFTAISGGERKRTMIAAALAQEPRLLLLDEPTAGLDVAAQAALAEILDRLCGQGLAIVMASHDLNLAARLCGRIALLQAGEIAGEGPPAEVLTAERLGRLFGTPVRVSRHEADGLPIALPDLRRRAGGGGAP